MARHPAERTGTCKPPLSMSCLRGDKARPRLALDAVPGQLARPSLPRSLSQAQAGPCPDGVHPSRVQALRRPHRFPTELGGRRVIPTKSPRIKRHSPAYGGTAANMAVLALTSHYVGSAGLMPLTAGTLPVMTELLVSGRPAVRSRSPAPPGVLLAADVPPQPARRRAPPAALICCRRTASRRRIGSSRTTVPLPDRPG